MLIWCAAGVHPVCGGVNLVRSGVNLVCSDVNLVRIGGNMTLMSVIMVVAIICNVSPC